MMVRTKKLASRKRKTPEPTKAVKAKGMKWWATNLRARKLWTRKLRATNHMRCNIAFKHQRCLVL
ncbi:unnamed protein product [Linum tenue]|uniref:Uncharacterized protein n=1 Tax=Linum tenue TaxID=586396 RepID=A0AAV0I2U3_9ROSI|nr:unnamed protein product [Linum tenue]